MWDGGVNGTGATAERTSAPAVAPARLLDAVAEHEARAGRDVGLVRLEALDGRGRERSRDDRQQRLAGAERGGEREDQRPVAGRTAALHERRRRDGQAGARAQIGERA